MSLIEDYYRRYLNDPLVPDTPDAPITPPPGTETALTTYFRRYLNDPA